MLNRLADKLSLTNFAYLALALAACAALVLPSAASAAGSGGAVVFSRVVTKTATEIVKDAQGNPVKEVVKDAEGNPVKNKDGEEETRDKTEVKTTIEGGLFAVKDGRLNQLTEDSTDTEPSFSPDSRAIVFSRSGDIFSVRADGSGLRRVTGGPELDTAPKVAPNGRYVLFERRSREGAPADLYKVNLNGGATRALATTPDEEHEASFSNDGKLILFVHSVPETGGGSADDIYSLRPSGAGLTRLTKTGRVDEWHPRYFAGGIVYSRGRNSEGDSAFADIYTMRRNGTKARAQVVGAGSAYVEDVSPNGHTLLFRREQGLWVKRVGGGAARKLTELPDESQTNAVFSSDGKHVAAFIEADQRTQLSSISVADGSDRELARGVVPTETTPTSGTVTTLGPIITWQPSR
jgi:dipeptidyl aminopeptidase/acylaminoacyl peptidase